MKHEKLLRYSQQESFVGNTIDVRTLRVHCTGLFLCLSANVCASASATAPRNTSRFDVSSLLPFILPAFSLSLAFFLPFFPRSSQGTSSARAKMHLIRMCGIKIKHELTHKLPFAIRHTLFSILHPPSSFPILLSSFRQFLHFY